MGKIEKNIIKQSLRFKNKIPDRIANAPKLNQGLQLYLEAFYELMDERQAGMDISPISRKSILDYAEFYKFDEEQTYSLLYLIKELDHAYLKHVRSKTTS